jgi:hypothetical protein
MAQLLRERIGQDRVVFGEQKIHGRELNPRSCRGRFMNTRKSRIACRGDLRRLRALGDWRKFRESTVTQYKYMKRIAGSMKPDADLTRREDASSRRFDDVRHDDVEQRVDDHAGGTCVPGLTGGITSELPSFPRGAW